MNESKDLISDLIGRLVTFIKKDAKVLLQEFEVSQTDDLFLSL